jgi:hypothetical protein
LNLPARLDPARVRKVADAFPTSLDWQRLLCTSLRRQGSRGDDPARDWSPLKHCNKKGGLYAFLFPSLLFKAPRRIKLDGPSRRKIEFEFHADENLILPDGSFVAYVGRTSTLLVRLKLHFSLAKVNTGAQVQYGLVKCRIAKNRREAALFMLKHASIAYAILDGDAHVANRDIIEVALWSRYMTPFNIKSEH